MKYETSKRKLKIIWNDTELTDMNIQNLNFQYEKIKDNKILRSTHRIKKIKYFVQEGILEFDSHDGFWYTNIVISLQNVSIKILTNIKIALLPLIPEFLQGRIYRGGEEKQEMLLRGGYNKNSPIKFADKGENNYDLLVAGSICNYNFREYWSYNEEEKIYIEVSIPYRLIIAIANPAEYF